MNNNLIDMKQYTCECLILVLSLVALSVLIKENNRLSVYTKEKFFRGLFIISAASLFGWLSLFMNGKSKDYVTLHAFVKSLDYCLFPCAGLVIAEFLNYYKFRKTVFTILIFNAVFELLSIYTKWSFYIDENFVYKSGPYHFVYEICTIISIVYTTLALLNYGKKFTRENIKSLLCIVTVILLSVVLQEWFNIRVMHIGLAPSIILLFIHLNEYDQLQTDVDIGLKEKLLRTDALTGLGSRFLYNEKVNYYSIKANQPKNLAALVIDINGLKQINDLYSHSEGDRVIRQTARFVTQAFGADGECLRTGGDEFVVISKADEEILKKEINTFMNAVENWHDEKTGFSVSLGYCYVNEFPDCVFEDVINEADERMYNNKREYYSNYSVDRRTRKDLDK